MTTKTEGKPGFVEKEKVDSISFDDGTELRFSIVEIGKSRKADIRLFEERRRKLSPSAHGIVVSPEIYGRFQEGVSKLGRSLQGK